MFSDGTMLIPGFGVKEPCLLLAWNQSHTEYKKTPPLDSWHATATAFEGRLSFDFGLTEVPEQMFLGEEHERTTVQEFVQAIDE